MAPVLDPVEHTLDDVAGFVNVPVIFELNFSVLARRNTGFGTDLDQPVAQVVCIISSVCDDGASFGDIRLKALAGLGNISPIACRQMQVDGAACAVADQMKLAVQPAFCLADIPPLAGVFLTPLAAMRWVLTWLASIISVDGSVPSRTIASKIRSKTPASDQRL